MSDHFKDTLCLYIVFVIWAANSRCCARWFGEESTIVSIPKSKNVNLTDSSNYRGIALSSIFGKIVDLVVLSRYGDRLCTSERSTNICTMVLKEAIAYYVNNGSSVFCTLLDVTKAFDRVEYVKMFKLLFDRKLLPVCIRLLVNMYTSQVTRV